MTRTLIRALNGLLSAVVALSLVVCMLYAGYALWDNRQIYAAAENVRDDMLRLKPRVPERQGEAEPEGPSFAELRAINPDVCAWLTMDNTMIDYPVLQGESNLSYISTDVYGNFSMPGSIFLDYRCDNTFRSPYALLYGHHMARRQMFGDLDLYKDAAFFEENRTGTLMLPDRTYGLEVVACMVVTSSDEFIFRPTRWEKDVLPLLEYAGENSLHLHRDLLDELTELAKTPAQLPQLLALSTCSSEYTEARTIVLTVMREQWAGAAVPE